MIDTRDEQWYANRMKGIGGSEAAAVIGESEYRSPYDIWKIKTGRTTSNKDNKAMYAGRLLEPVIRDAYTDLTGDRVIIPGWKQHEKYPFIVGNIDGLVEEKQKIVEIKTSRYQWQEKPEYSNVPPDYFFQVQHYLLLYDFEQADLIALFSGQDFKIYPIEANKEIQSLMIQLYTDFWNKVVNDIRPEILTLSDVSDCYKKDVGTTCILSEESVEATKAIKECKEEIKRLQATIEEKELLIKKEMQLNAIGEYNKKTLVTWKSTNGRTYLDTERLKKERPEVYSEYSKKTNPTRSFNVK